MRIAGIYLLSLGKVCEHLLTSNLLQLSKYPTLNNLEKQTSIPKTYAVLGLIATYFFFIFFNIGGALEMFNLKIKLGESS
jgi:hypothetical protein